MGGKAIKHSTRIQKAEYFQLADEVKSLVEDFYQTKAFIVPAYRTKESFGDLDVVVQSNKSTAVLSKDGHHAFREKMGCLDKGSYLLNDSVLSFDYKGFQVDLIFGSESDDDISLNLAYLSWNDLGMLIGLMAMSMGLKYGHNGLWKRLYDENRQHYGDIQLTKNVEQIYTFLGFDFNKWKAGFDTIDEIYEFVTTSKYFNPKYFQLESMNRDKKDRTKKRPNYTKFLEYCAELKNVNPPTLKHLSLDDLDSMFPDANVHAKHQVILDRIARKKAIKEKFNGLLIQQWFGLDVKELSSAINATKDSFPDRLTFEEFVLSSDENEIRTMISQAIKKEAI